MSDQRDYGFGNSLLNGGRSDGQLIDKRIQDMIESVNAFNVDVLGF